MTRVLGCEAFDLVMEGQEPLTAVSIALNFDPASNITLDGVRAGQSKLKVKR